MNFSILATLITVSNQPAGGAAAPLLPSPMPVDRQHPNTAQTIKPECLHVVSGQQTHKLSSDGCSMVLIHPFHTSNERN